MTEQKEYNFCIRCGRRLISQENRLRGMGKVCYEKSQRPLNTSIEKFLKNRHK